MFPQAQCPICMSEDTRVNVVFFNEPAPMYAPTSNALGGLREQDVLVVVGTSAQVVNPIRWLTTPTHIWVVDPSPSPKLTHRPNTLTFEAPANQLRQVLDEPWQQHLKKNGARG